VGRAPQGRFCVGDEITFAVHSIVSEDDEQRVLIKIINDTLLICRCFVNIVGWS